MSVKEFVLKKLEENRGIPLSGEAIANSLSVSRAAVWKAVRALEAEGYHIEAVPNQAIRFAPITICFPHRESYPT